jgi:2-methylcitrate dehydratase PrpD
MDGDLGNRTPATDLTRAIAEQAAAVDYNALPETVRALARQCVLDYYGVALAGSDDPLVAILLDEFSEAGGAGQAGIIGHAARLPVLSAALVNGAIGHALDYDDVNLAMPGHPSVAILPGLLALAEQRRSSGSEVIAAFVAGYETACRIGMALRPGHYNLGFHATGTVGAFGAAAACARLLGLDADATAQALGIAGTQAAGLKSQFGTMCKPFHAGKASQNASRASL